MTTFRRQLGDPTTTADPYICSLETGAMLLDFHTAGRISIWGGELQAALGLTTAQLAGTAPRADGTYHKGASIKDVQRAWTAYGETLTNKTGDGWAAVIAALNAGEGVMLQGDYDQFSLATRCQDNFLGHHAILTLPEKQGTAWLTGDPLCSDFKYVEEAELRAYATKLSSAIYFATASEGQPAQEPAMPAILNPKPADGIFTTNPNGATAFRVRDGADGPVGGGEPQVVVMQGELANLVPDAWFTDGGKTGELYAFPKAGGTFVATVGGGTADPTAAKREQYDADAATLLGKRP